MKTKNIILITLGVFATAVTTFFIVNHLNNDEDKNITERLSKLGDELGIKVLDHVILGKDKHWSWREEN